MHTTRAFLLCFLAVTAGLIFAAHGTAHAACSDTVVYQSAALKGLTLEIRQPYTLSALPTRIRYLANAADELDKVNQDDCNDDDAGIGTQMLLAKHQLLLVSLAGIEAAWNEPLAVHGLRNSTCKRIAAIDARYTTAHAYETLFSNIAMPSDEDSDGQALRTATIGLAQRVAEKLGIALPDGSDAASFATEQKEKLEEARVAHTGDCQPVFKHAVPHSVFMLLFTSD